MAASGSEQPDRREPPSVAPVKFRHGSCIDVSMRINKLLLELDPGKFNTAALERARSIATSFGADVELMVCEAPRVIPAPTIVAPATLAVAQEDYRADVARWAAAKASELEEAGLSVNVTVTAEQPRYEAILDQADATNADLIMREMGEHGRLRRLFMGATDWDLIRHAKQPVWLVQPDSPDEGRPNVLAAVDPLHPKDEHMNLDQRLLDVADSLARALSGSLHVYHTFQLTPVAVAAPSVAVATPAAAQINADVLDKIEAAHRRALDELLSGRELADNRVHLLEGHPAAKIDEVIEANGIGVVVAGSISRSWLDRLLVGSTAESFLGAVSCDLVLLKAGS